jgi:oxaloacetate decarboxylase (Na+ extruding) subunit alpha
MARIELVDQTLRDGQQSYWGMRMKAGEMLPVAGGSTPPATGSST